MTIMKNASGFTLIELMVAIAVLAIILALGVPAFTATIQNTRATTAANDLVVALQLARSEAVKRRQPTQVCRRDAAGTACEDGTDWAVGWLIQSGGNVIKVWDQIEQTAATGPNTGVTFAASGLADGAAAFSVIAPQCSGDQRRVINVSATGRVGVTRAAC